MYRILDREAVAPYLRGIAAVDEHLGAGELLIDEVGDGNLNYVYKVRNADHPERSVVLKQAVPYLRMVGEEWPLSRDRMTFEIRALTAYNELVPELVPTIFHADEEMSTLVMQCLDDHIILRRGMIDGITYPKVAGHIGEFLAETLFRTSAFGMESIERRQLMDRFTLNTELCKLTEEFIFTFPYMTHDSNYVNPTTDAWADENLRSDTAYKLGVLHHKDLFLTKTEALLHADLHTGSLMVNQDETYVIDMEFAYFGPIGFDVGKIISNFLLCATAQSQLPGGAEYREWCIDQIAPIWNGFAERFVALWESASHSAMLVDGLLSDEEVAEFRRSTMANIFVDTIGFAACSMARRTLGIAGVADIRDIEDTEVRASLEIANLELSRMLMSKRSTLGTIAGVQDLVRDYYSNTQI